MPRLSGLDGNLAAFLDTIAWSEGTTSIAGSDDGYNVLVGGHLFHGYEDHPRQLIRLPSLHLSSSAAGRYQLLMRYYDAYKTLMGLHDFSPESQDRIALQQIKECRALIDIIGGQFDDAIDRCARIWASFPGNTYGQHTRTMPSLRRAFIAAGGVIH